MSDDRLPHDDSYSKSIKIIDVDALEAAFEAPLPAVIGEGKRNATDLAEYVDQEERSYNLRMGLDRNGDPLPTHDLIDRGESIYGHTLEAGFDMLADSGDTFEDGFSEFQGIINENPFNNH